MATTADPTSLTQPWGIGDAATGVFGGYVGSIVVAGILQTTNTSSIGLQFVTNIPLWIGFLVVPIWATRTRGRGPVVDLHVAVRPIDVLGLVAGGLTQIVVGWLYHPFVSDKDLEKPARQLAHTAQGLPAKYLLVVMTCLVAPVLEEFFYRGLVLRAIRRRLPDWATVLVVAVVFAAMHFEPLQLPGLFLFGAVASTLCIKSDRLGPAVFAHIGFNAVALWQLHIF